MKLNLIRAELNKRLRNPNKPEDGTYNKMYFDIMEQLETPIANDLISYLISVDNFNLNYRAIDSTLWNMYFEIIAPLNSKLHNETF